MAGIELRPVPFLVFPWWGNQPRQFSLFLGKQLDNPLPRRLVLLGEQLPMVVFDVEPRDEDTLVHGI